MNYSEMSDGEISVLVGRLQKPKYEVVVNPHNPKGAQYIRMLGKYRHTFGFLPLVKAEDGFPILIKNRIAIAPASKTIWEASHESGLRARHKNPLRAAMIVYLMMHDKGEE